MAETPTIDIDLEETLSVPRDNGQMVFDEPWERRLFGLTLALCRSDVCDWETFRQRLIRRIADDETRPYWRSWAVALEDVLAAASVVTRAELDARYLEMLNRPPGHDHRH